MNRTTARNDQPASPAAPTSDGLPASSSSQVDYKAALKRLGGDHSFFLELVKIFEEDAPNLIGEIKEAYQQDDAENLKRHAHALKGLALNFSADDFVKSVADIEKAGRENSVAAASPQVADLTAGYQRLFDELSTYRK